MTKLMTILAPKLRRIKILRPIIAATVLDAAVGSLLAASVLVAQAEGSTSIVSIDNFSFGPQTLTVKAGTTVTWTNRDDIPHGSPRRSAADFPAALLPSHWWGKSDIGENG